MRIDANKIVVAISGAAMLVALGLVWAKADESQRRNDLKIAVAKAGAQTSAGKRASPSPADAAVEQAMETAPTRVELAP